jgi:hypothetical protein
MVGVGVCEENRVDAADVVRERLLPQIGGRVDENGADIARVGRFGTVVGRFDQDRGPGAAIPRIGRAAHGAVAADGWYALRCTAAKDRDSQGVMMRFPPPLASTNRSRSS